MNKCIINFKMSIALTKAQADYEEKIKSSNRSQDKTLFKLAWQIHELEELIKEMRQIAVDLSTLIGRVLNIQHDLVKENFAANLISTRVSLEEAVKKLIRHQRTAATHIMVFMISPESRNHKPYALPVQCLPITALKDQQCRELANQIIAAMVKRNMKVVGRLHKDMISIIDNFT